jgi:hypothetical protein
MRYAIVVLWVFLGATGWADEPLHVLEKWTTTDGKTAEATFQSIDESAGTVTILVPRTIELSRLDEESRQRIKRRAVQIREILAEQAETAAAQSREVMLVGLVDPTYAEWTAAAEPERVATVGNILFSLISRGAIKDDLLNEMRSAKGFNEASAMLAQTLLKLSNETNQELLGKETFLEVVLMVLVTNGQLKKN